MHFNHITGGTGDVGDDRHVPTGQGIQQAGFANIRGTQNGHGNPVAQAFAAMAVVASLVLNLDEVLCLP